MFRFTVYLFLATFVVGRICPLLASFLLVFGVYRQWKWATEDDPFRDSMGYKMRGLGQGYNTLYYPDWNDWKPPPKRSFWYKYL